MTPKETRRIANSSEIEDFSRDEVFKKEPKKENKFKKILKMILGMDDVEHVKPNPEGILKVMNTFHCLNGLYIGDNVTDIQAGKNAGIYTAGVKWTPKGYQAMQALAPDLLIDDMSEIITFVERKMNG